jgi:hypothetical protein
MIKELMDFLFMILAPEGTEGETRDDRVTLGYTRYFGLFLVYLTILSVAQII